VRYEITSFQGREREFFLEAYRRSGIYRPRIVAELQKAGMPEALSWLPLVESGFKDRALSTARALGLSTAPTGSTSGWTRRSPPRARSPT
jgi:membrane-bound lytic murein transglycosylase D